MTAGDIAQIMTAAGVLATAGVGAASLIASLRNARKIDSVVTGVAEVHAATNGLTSKLITLTAKSSLAEGVKQGRDEKGAEIQAQAASRADGS